jgi:hypothetical protein
MGTGQKKGWGKNSGNCMYASISYACYPVKSNGLSLDKAPFSSILKAEFLWNKRLINPSIVFPMNRRPLVVKSLFLNYINNL